MKKVLLNFLLTLSAMMSAQAEDTATHDNRLYITIGSTNDLTRVPITLHLENPTIDLMPVIEQKDYGANISTFFLFATIFSILL